MTFAAIFAKRHARYRWVSLPAAAVALLFAGLANEDHDISMAVPYLGIAGLSMLYLVRPMYVLWVLPFAAFTAFTLIMVVALFMGLGSGPLSEWLTFFAFGAVPTTLLWLARPRPEA